jgi:hypothetical protein
MDNVDSTDPVVRLAPPIIDKIGITVPVTQHAAQAYLIERIEECRRHQGVHELRPRRRAGYAYTVSMLLGSSAKLLVQAAPTGTQKQRSAFARLECNPSNAGPAGMREFHMITADLLPADYVLVARASRVDIAIDMWGACISELAIRSRRHLKSAVWFGRRGDLQSVYMGDKKSGSQIVVYDKARQLRETKRMGFDEACTRFEIHLRTYMPVFELVRLKNPFSGVEVFSCPMDLFGRRLDQHQMFLDSVLQRGLHAALRQLPPTLRRTIELALEHDRCSYWEPEKLWSGWGAAVEALGFVPR